MALHNEVIEDCVSRPEKRALKAKVHYQARLAQPLGIAPAILRHKAFDEIADTARQPKKLSIRRFFD